MELEDTNQKLRTNFDITIMNLETKVGNEKQKAFEYVVNDYKSELSKKVERINEIEKESKYHLDLIWNKELKHIENNYKEIIENFK